MNNSIQPEIRAFFDEPTNTVSYLVWDPATKEGVAIDPVLNFDNRSGKATVAVSRRHARRGREARGDDQASAGDACARGPSVGCPLYQAEDWRVRRDR